MKETNIVIGTCYILGTVESGRLNKWMNYEIEKRKTVFPGKKPYITYGLMVDGEDEGEDFKTLKEAREYVKNLRDAWLEDHPGEKLF